MKIRGLFAAFSLVVVLGACTHDIVLPTDEAAESVLDQTAPSPQYDEASRGGGTMGSGA